jgi:hypothetical protein
MIGLLIFMLSVIACVDNTAKAGKPNSIAGVTIVAINSAFIVDSTSMSAILNSINVSSTVKNQITAFYKQRGYQYAWIGSNGLSTSGYNYYKQIINDSQAFANTTFACKQLDTF